MKTHFKFTTLEKSAKYVIEIEAQFFKSKPRHFIFRTEKQLESFFRTAIKRNIVENLKDNGLGLILFEYKNKEFAIAVEIFSNPSKKTTTIIKIKYLLLENHRDFNKIYNACPLANIANMTDYIIPTRIVVRDFVDIHYDTFVMHKEKINTYLSSFVYTNKKALLDEYDISNVLKKITGFLFSGNSSSIDFNNILDKEPFWIWIKEELLESDDNYYTSSDSDNFLCCLSLAKKTKNQKVFYELLLDQIHKNPTEQKVKVIKEYKEAFLENSIFIQKKATKNKTARKVSNKGLKIVRKSNADK